MPRLIPAISADKLTDSLLRKTAAFPKLFMTAAITWTAVIFIACLWPGKELPHSDIPFVDKWTHFVLFGVFSILWLLACPPNRLKPRRRLIGITLIAIILGALVEGLQMALPALGRSGDMIDMVADAVGAVLGTGAYLFIRRLAN